MMLHMHNATRSAAPILSQFTAEQHRIQGHGLGYARPLTDDEIMRAAPAIYADAAHESRSDRYAYIPTRELVDSMRAEGFLPVNVSQARAREEGRAGFAKHLIRFRREDQLAAPEAREVVLLNSHDGSSGFRLMAGVFRLVCANGLIVGQADNEIRVRHSGSAVDNVIEGAYRVVNEFDKVQEQIEGMKALPMRPEHRHAFASAALALRFEEPENCGISPEQIMRPRRAEDQPGDLWTAFNVAQENIIRGGLHGRKIDANGRRTRTSTRAVNGIDQNVALNRGLWVLAEEMRKLAA